LKVSVIITEVFQQNIDYAPIFNMQQNTENILSTNAIYFCQRTPCDRD
jgi:hypothetical protein